MAGKRLNPKSIIFCVSNDLHFDRRMIRICESLRKGGYQVNLVGRKRKSSPPVSDLTFTQTRLNLYFERGVFFYLELNIRLFWYLVSKRPDSIGAVDLDTLPGCWLASRMFGKRLIFDAHEWYEEAPELANSPFKKKFWKWLGMLLIPRCDDHMTVSFSLAEQLSKRYKKQFLTIRNIHPISGVDRHDNPPKKIIVYAGVLNQGRGLPELIAAMDQLPEYKLWLLGDGNLMDGLKEQVSRGNCGFRVKFWGWVPPEKLPEILSKCWLGIHLLDASSLSYQYSLSNKFFDYVQCLIPQMVSDLPEYRKLIEEHKVGFLVKNLSVENIIRQIEEISEDPDFYSLCVEQCKMAKVKWSWAAEQKKLWEIF